MKTINLIILLLFSISIYAQKIDTIITKEVIIVNKKEVFITLPYKSYFNNDLKEPVYVSYKLYKGGGDCSRDKFRFKNNTKIKTAEIGDYGLAKKVNTPGYDQGHLANSEDFANDCVKDELTFRFYNCLPQTPNLNRGCWKHWETKIREESQTDSLLIICGGIFSTKKMGNAYIPDYCWKVVKSLSKDTITHVLYFTNTNTSTVKEITLTELEYILKYKVPLKY